MVSTILFLLLCVWTGQMKLIRNLFLIYKWGSYFIWRFGFPLEISLMSCSDNQKLIFFCSFCLSLSLSACVFIVLKCEMCWKGQFFFLFTMIFNRSEKKNVLCPGDKVYEIEISAFAIKTQVKKKIFCLPTEERNKHGDRPTNIILDQ